jgi:hypothetical protein
LILFALGCFAVSQTAQAVVPPPDGGYPGGNTAEGQSALFSLTGGTYNTAVGVFSLRTNIEGNFNTAVGAGTLLANTANNNTATGAGALLSNTTGNDNTATGVNALASNTATNNNTATGAAALANNTGSANTATGAGALENNVTGFGNTALGFHAGANVTTAAHVICIGAVGANVSNSCFVDHIRNVTTAFADAIPVMVDSHSQLGTMSSSRRFKQGIKPMESASEAILALNPVTFHYKSDETNTPQFGLIAEEVAEVNPDLVVRDENGETYTVRYDAVNAMLLNEFLKEHRKVEKQQAIVSQLKSIVARQETVRAKQQKEIEGLTATMKEQAAQIHRVSQQLELRNSAPQMVNDTR